MHAQVGASVFTTVRARVRVARLDNLRSSLDELDLFGVPGVLGSTVLQLWWSWCSWWSWWSWRACFVVRRVLYCSGFVWERLQVHAHASLTLRTYHLRA